MSIETIESTTTVPVSPWAYKVLLNYLGKDPHEILTADDLNTCINDLMQLGRLVHESTTEVLKANEVLREHLEKHHNIVTI